jgi:hypothetical protein
MPKSRVDTTPAAIVDHQAHWYPRSCVESLIGRSVFPRVERGRGGDYVLTVGDGLAQPQMGGSWWTSTSTSRRPTPWGSPCL